MNEATSIRTSMFGAWWMVVVFSLAGFVSYTHRLILSVLVDPLRADLDLGDASVSLLQGAAFAIIYSIAGLPLGRLADRWRRRRLVVGGSLLWCLGCILCGLSTDFWTLFAARAVVGVGEAALAPAAVSMLADRFPPEQRGTSIGIFFMGMLAGAAAAIGIGGHLLQAAQAGYFAAIPWLAQLSPWRIVLVVTGLAGLGVPLLLLTVREPVRRTKSASASFADAAARLAADRSIIGPLLIALALLAVGDYSVLSWGPSVLGRVFAWRPEAIGSTLGTATMIAGIGGSVLGGILSDLAARRGGAPARLGFAALIAILAALAGAMVAIRQSDLVVIGVGGWILCSSIASTAGIAALLDLVSDDLRGVTVSLVAFCNTLLGLGLGPTAVALVAEHGFHRSGAIGLALALVAAPAAMASVLLFLRCRRGVFRRALSSRLERFHVCRTQMSKPLAAHRSNHGCGGGV